LAAVVAKQWANGVFHSSSRRTQSVSWTTVMDRFAQQLSVDLAMVILMVAA
jgi:hypothetical protein